ncbi:HDOD domain-containing protein [Cupriavidus basilensis]
MEPDGPARGFPTLQFCIDNVFKTLSSDISVGEMAAAVLSDFSLSQKVIRLANSAMYRSFGGEVTTVSRAILVLGVDAISHLTLGVQLLDYFSGVAINRPQASHELKQALIAGELTRLAQQRARHRTGRGGRRLHADAPHEPPSPHLLLS